MLYMSILIQLTDNEVNNFVDLVTTVDIWILLCGHVILLLCVWVHPFLDTDSPSRGGLLMSD